MTCNCSPGVSYILLHSSLSFGEGRGEARGAGGEVHSFAFKTFNRYQLTCV